MPKEKKAPAGGPIPFLMLRIWLFSFLVWHAHSLNLAHYNRRRALSKFAAGILTSTALPLSTNAVGLPSLPIDLELPVLLPSKFQKAANELSIYQKPIRDMTRALNRMGEQEQEPEDKIFFFGSISAYFSTTQSPSLISTLQRQASLGLLGEAGPGIATSAKTAVENLQTALRAGSLDGEKSAVKDLSNSLEGAFDSLQASDNKLKIPKEKEVGNGSFFGILPPIRGR